MLPRTLRYLGSLLSEPIIGMALKFACRIQHFKSVRHENWILCGSEGFIQTANESKKWLESEDIRVLNEINNKYTIMLAPEGPFSFPLWRYGGVSKEYVAWGREGILAYWVYLYFHYTLSNQRGRWFMSVATNSIEISQKARADTHEWLISHEFPEELIETFAQGTEVMG